MARAKKKGEESVTGRSKVVIASDLHILKKPGMWEGRAEIAGDDIFALQQIAELCRTTDADLMLLGDVLDSVTNLPRPVVWLREHLLPLLKEGRKVQYLQGQHEIVVQAHYTNYPWLSIIEGTEHIGGKAFDFLGYKAYALDYFSAPFEHLMFSKIPGDTQVLFLHGTADLANSIGCHFSMENIPSQIKLVIAGDYHKACEFTLKNGGMLWYCGSTWQTAADEPREKSVLLCDIADGAGIKVERIPLKTRKIVKYTELTGGFPELKLSSEDRQSLPEELHTPVVLVDMPIEPEVYEKLSIDAHVYTTSGANPNTPSQAVIAAVDNMTDEAILSSYVDREAHKSEFDFTLDVLSSNVEDAVQRLKDRLGVPVEDARPMSAMINLDGENILEEEEVSP